MQSRIMAIDYGEKRIGIALTDLMQIIASPYKVYESINFEVDIQYICDLINSQQVETIVVGLPLNSVNSKSTLIEKIQKFGYEIANKTKVNLVFQDERLTSIEANEILKDAGISIKESKKLIDKISACLILESFLNERSENEKRKKSK
ncbi:MAG: Holliday junction resolvase RuvX [Clostridia bacterium]|jgi:putative Holliday junction resolvase|nr:Holliday junction resolvase RuvX [Clostridia bacterium]MDD4408505.1 Holliday junction resolvase RuvX [Clostridia bacterium]